MDVHDALSLQINPEFSFKQLMGLSRTRNLHGRRVPSNLGVINQPEVRKTRSGQTYLCDVNKFKPGILKSFKLE